VTSCSYKDSFWRVTSFYFPSRQAAQWNYQVGSDSFLKEEEDVPYTCGWVVHYRDSLASLPKEGTSVLNSILVEEDTEDVCQHWQDVVDDTTSQEFPFHTCPGMMGEQSDGMDEDAFDDGGDDDEVALVVELAVEEDVTDDLASYRIQDHQCQEEHSRDEFASCC